MRPNKIQTAKKKDLSKRVVQLKDGYTTWHSEQNIHTVTGVKLGGLYSVHHKYYFDCPSSNHDKERE